MNRIHIQKVPSGSSLKTWGVLEEKVLVDASEYYDVKQHAPKYPE